MYLFAAYALVWIGIFLYLYLLARRSEALAREVAMLRDRAAQTARPAAPQAARAARARAEPS